MILTVLLTVWTIDLEREDETSKDFNPMNTRTRETDRMNICIEIIMVGQVHQVMITGQVHLPVILGMMVLDEKAI